MRQSATRVPTEVSLAADGGAGNVHEILFPETPPPGFGFTDFSGDRMSAMLAVVSPLPTDGAIAVVSMTARRFPRADARVPITVEMKAVAVAVPPLSVGVLENPYSVQLSRPEGITGGSFTVVAQRFNRAANSLFSLDGETGAIGGSFPAGQFPDPPVFWEMEVELADPDQYVVGGIRYVLSVTVFNTIPLDAADALSLETRTIYAGTDYAGAVYTITLNAGFSAEYASAPAGFESAAGVYGIPSSSPIGAGERRTGVALLTVSDTVRNNITPAVAAVSLLVLGVVSPSQGLVEATDTAGESVAALVRPARPAGAGGSFELVGVAGGPAERWSVSADGAVRTGTTAPEPGLYTLTARYRHPDLLGSVEALLPVLVHDRALAIMSDATLAGALPPDGRLSVLVAAGYAGSVTVLVSRDSDVALIVDRANPPRGFALGDGGVVSIVAPAVSELSGGVGVVASVSGFRLRFATVTVSVHLVRAQARAAVFAGDVWDAVGDLLTLSVPESLPQVSGVADGFAVRIAGGDAGLDLREVAGEWVVSAPQPLAAGDYAATLAVSHASAYRGDWAATVSVNVSALAGISDSALASALPEGTIVRYAALDYRGSVAVIASRAATLTLFAETADPPAGFEVSADGEVRIADSSPLSADGLSGTIAVRATLYRRSLRDAEVTLQINALAAARTASLNLFIGSEGAVGELNVSEGTLPDVPGHDGSGFVVGRVGGDAELDVSGVTIVVPTALDMDDAEKSFTLTVTVTHPTAFLGEWPVTISATVLSMPESGVPPGMMFNGEVVRPGATLTAEDDAGTGVDAMYYGLRRGLYYVAIPIGKAAAAPDPASITYKYEGGSLVASPAAGAGIARRVVEVSGGLSLADYHALCDSGGDSNYLGQSWRVPSASEVAALVYPPSRSDGSGGTVHAPADVSEAMVQEGLLEMQVPGLHVENPRRTVPLPAGGVSDTPALSGVAAAFFGGAPLADDEATGYDAGKLWAAALSGRDDGLSFGAMVPGAEATERLETISRRGTPEDQIPERDSTRFLGGHPGVAVCVVSHNADEYESPPELSVLEWSYAGKVSECGLNAVPGATDNCGNGRSLEVGDDGLIRSYAEDQSSGGTAIGGSAGLSDATFTVRAIRFGGDDGSAALATLSGEADLAEVSVSHPGLAAVRVSESDSEIAVYRLSLRGSYRSDKVVVWLKAEPRVGSSAVARITVNWEDFDNGAALPELPLRFGGQVISTVGAQVSLVLTRRSVIGNNAVPPTEATLTYHGKRRGLHYAYYVTEQNTGGPEEAAAALLPAVRWAEMCERGGLGGNGQKWRIPSIREAMALVTDNAEEPVDLGANVNRGWGLEGTETFTLPATLSNDANAPRLVSLNVRIPHTQRESDAPSRGVYHDEITGLGLFPASGSFNAEINDLILFRNRTAPDVAVPCVLSGSNYGDPDPHLATPVLIPTTDPAVSAPVQSTVITFRSALPNNAVVVPAGTRMTFTIGMERRFMGIVSEPVNVVSGPNSGARFQFPTHPFNTPELSVVVFELNNALRQGGSGHYAVLNAGEGGAGRISVAMTVERSSSPADIASLPSRELRVGTGYVGALFTITSQVADTTLRVEMVRTPAYDANGVSVWDRLLGGAVDAGRIVDGSPDGTDAPFRLSLLAYADGEPGDRVIVAPASSPFLSSLLTMTLEVRTSADNYATAASVHFGARRLALPPVEVDVATRPVAGETLAVIPPLPEHPATPETHPLSEAVQLYEDASTTWPFYIYSDGRVVAHQGDCPDGVMDADPDAQCRIVADDGINNGIGVAADARPIFAPSVYRVTARVLSAPSHWVHPYRVVLITVNNGVARPSPESDALVGRALVYPMVLRSDADEPLPLAGTRRTGSVPLRKHRAVLAPGFAGELFTLSLSLPAGYEMNTATSAFAPYPHIGGGCAAGVGGGVAVSADGIVSAEANASVFYTTTSCPAALEFPAAPDNAPAGFTHSSVIVHPPANVGGVSLTVDVYAETGTSNVYERLRRANGLARIPVEVVRIRAGGELPTVYYPVRQDSLPLGGPAPQVGDPLGESVNGVVVWDEIVRVGQSEREQVWSALGEEMFFVNAGTGGGSDFMHVLPHGQVVATAVMAAHPSASGVYQMTLAGGVPGMHGAATVAVTVQTVPQYTVCAGHDLIYNTPKSDCLANRSTAVVFAEAGDAANMAVARMTEFTDAYTIDYHDGIRDYVESRGFTVFHMARSGGAGLEDFDLRIPADDPLGDDEYRDAYFSVTVYKDAEKTVPSSVARFHIAVAGDDRIVHASAPVSITESRTEDAGFSGAVMTLIAANDSDVLAFPQTSPDAGASPEELVSAAGFAVEFANTAGAPSRAVVSIPPGRTLRSGETREVEFRINGEHRGTAGTTTRISYGISVRVTAR